jgi:hypothetical protein
MYRDVCCAEIGISGAFVTNVFGYGFGIHRQVSYGLKNTVHRAVTCWGWFRGRNF